MKRFVLIAMLIVCITITTHAQVDDADGFHQEEFEVTAVLPGFAAPSATDTPGSAVISGNTPLTVVFNQSVIALGEDFSLHGGRVVDGVDVGSLPDVKVPFHFEGCGTSEDGERCVINGKLRWITTYIARFDPEDVWPTDLSFRVIINPRLRTHEAAVLSGVSAFAYTTPSLQMHVISVASEEAERITNGKWSADTIGIVASPEDPSDYRAINLPECPQDAVVSLSFTSKVSADLISSHLLMREVMDLDGDGKIDGNATVIPLIVTQGCGDTEDETTCVSVSFNPSAPRLRVDASYEILLPIGTHYHQESGDLKRASGVSVAGPRSFTFPFVQNSYLMGEHLNLRLLVRHGLSNNTSLESLAEAIEIGNPSDLLPLSIELKMLDEVTLQITAPFQPEESYSISVSAREDVRDGFGLPLQTIEKEISFASASTYTFGPTKNPTLQFEALPEGESADSNKIMYFWRPQYHSHSGKDFVHAKAVTRDTVAKFLPYISYSTQRPNFDDWDAVITEDPQEEFGSSWLDAGSLTQNSGSYFASFERYSGRDWTNGWPNNYIFSASNTTVSCVFAAPSLATCSVTDLYTNEPVGGASVDTYTVFKSTFTPPTRYGSGRTDKDGVVTVEVDDPPNTIHKKWVVVSDHAGHILVSPLNGGYYQRRVNQLATMVTDRAVYRPGETIYLKVFVRSPETGSIPSLPHLRCWITFDKEEEEYDMHVHDSEGSASVEIVVPAESKFGNKYLSIGFDKQHIVSVVNSAPILIAEPHPPTVQLQMASFLAYFDIHDGMDVNLDASTYLGTTVDSALIDLTVTATKTLSNVLYGCVGVTSSPGDSVCPSKLTQTILDSVLTNDVGHATYHLDASDITVFTLTEGDSVTIEATWIGPTGEVITSSLQKTVSRSAQKITLSSIERPVPQIPFQVQASLTGIESGLIGGQEVHIGLYSPSYLEGEENFSCGAHLGGSGVISQLQLTETDYNECSVTSSDKAPSSCVLMIPRMGHFYVVARSVEEEKVFSVMRVGATEAEWNERPLSASDSSVFIPFIPLNRQQDGTFTVVDPNSRSSGAHSAHAPLPSHESTTCTGESCENVAIFQTFIPYDSARVVSVVSSNDKTSTDNTIFTLEGAGLHRIVVPLDYDICQYGCGVAMIMTIKRQSSAPEVPVPTSITFDATAPLTVTHSETIKVGDSAHTLTGIDISLDRDVVGPATNTMITIDVNDPDFPQKTVAGSVCIFVVNKNMLDVKPLPLPTAVSTFTQDSSIFLSIWSSFNNWASRFSSEGTRDIMASRLQADAWYNPSQWPTTPEEQASFAPLDEWLESMYTAVTSMVYTPWRANWCGGRLEYPYLMMEEDTLESGGVGGEEADSPSLSSSPMPNKQSSSSASSSIVAIRTDFTVTPFHVFKLPLIEGKAHVNFTTGEELGTYAVRVVVVDTAHNALGSAEVEQVVRQPLVSMSADAPEVVHSGDRVLMGATLTLTNDESFRDDVTVSVRLDFDCALLSAVSSGGNQIPTIQTVTLSGSHRAPVEVLFPLMAIGIGEASYRITAFSASNDDVIDAYEDVVTVNGVMPRVYLATSMVVDEGSSGWDEALLLPPAIPYSGDMSITMGFGHYAAVGSYASSLMITGDRAMGYQYPGVYAVVSALASYGSVHLYDGASHEIALSHLAKRNFHAYMNYLKVYTIEGIGICSSFDTSACARYPSVSLNADAVYWASLAKDILTDKEKWLVEVWKQATEENLYSLLRRTSGRVNAATVAQVYLALGRDWQPSRFQDVLDFDTVLAREDLSNFASACMVLAHYGPSPTESPSDHTEDHLLLYSAIRRILDTVRIQERSAYLTSNPSSNNVDSTATSYAVHAFSIASYKRKGSANADIGDVLDRMRQVVPKLAYYVQGGADPSTYYYIPTDEASVALAVYDWVDVHITGASVEDARLDVTIKNGGAVLTAAELSILDSPSAAYGSSYEAFNASEPLVFLAEGAGEASIVVGMDFVPSDTSSEGISRGITVHKIIRRVDPFTNKPVGDAIDNARRGERLVVTLQVQNFDTLYDVVVKDPVAGGLEAMDPNLFSVDPLFWPVSVGGANWHWYSYFSKEFRGSEVVFRTSTLWSGVHEISYYATVVTRGKFVVPPAHAYEEKQKEVMGLSASSTMSIGETDVSAMQSHSVGLGFCIEHTITSRFAEMLNTGGTGTSPSLSTPSHHHYHKHQKTDQRDLYVSISVGCILLVVLVAVIIVLAVAWRRQQKKKSTFQRLAVESPEMDVENDIFLDNNLGDDEL